MLAAILTCGLTVTTMTSCSDDDDSGKPLYLLSHPYPR